MYFQPLCISNKPKGGSSGENKRNVWFKHFFKLQSFIALAEIHPRQLKEEPHSTACDKQWWTYDIYKWKLSEWEFKFSWTIHQSYTDIERLRTAYTNINLRLSRIQPQNKTTSTNPTNGYKWHMCGKLRSNKWHIQAKLPWNKARAIPNRPKFLSRSLGSANSQRSKSTQRSISISLAKMFAILHVCGW